LALDRVMAGRFGPLTGDRNSEPRRVTQKVKYTSVR